MTNRAIEFGRFPGNKWMCFGKCCCSQCACNHLQWSQRGRKVSRMTIRSNSNHTNVIMSADVQSALHFWRILHLGLIKYLEAGRCRGSSQGSYSRPARPLVKRLEKAAEEEKEGGSTWNNTRLSGLPSPGTLQGPPAPV